MPLTRFVLIRHGETVWNLEGRIQGWQDSPLTPRGLAQADALATRLAALSFDALYSSDLPRAALTAEKISRATGQPVLVDPRLRERNMGELEGLTEDERQRRFPHCRGAFRPGGLEDVVPGGETAAARLQRCLSFLNETALHHVGRTVVCVTHGGILTGLFKHVVGLAEQAQVQFARLNASLNTFCHDGQRLTLVTWGDISHLNGHGALDDV